MGKNSESSGSGAWLTFWGVIIGAVIALVGVVYKANMDHEIAQAPYTITAVANLTLTILAKTMTPISLPTYTATSTATRTPSMLSFTPTHSPGIGTKIPPVSPQPTPKWTPSGPTGKIAFYSERELRSQVHAQIYTVNIDGTRETRLSKREDCDDGSPSWSSDGKRVVFDTNCDHNWEIYIANADGTEAKNISNHPSTDQQPAWSPDGQYIAFFSDRRIIAIPDLYVMAPDGSSPVQISYGEFADSHPAWSYDSSRIAFNRTINEKIQIYIVDIYDTEKVLFNLTEKVKTRSGEIANCASATWSPDGRKIAFQSDVDGWWQIYSINTDGSGLKRLSNINAHDCRPYWSPDGYFIAFDSGNCEKESQINQIYIMNADGTKRELVTKSKGPNVAPAWWMPR